MKYYKQWKGHPEKLKEEGEPIGWFEVKEIYVFAQLHGNITEWKGNQSTEEQIKKKLISGQILHSSCAMYIGVK